MSRNPRAPPTRTARAPSPSTSGRTPGAVPSESRSRSRRRSVALLVFLPRAARAGVVAAHLGVLPLHRLRLRAVAAGEVHRLGLWLGRGEGALDALHFLLLILALAHDHVRLPEVLDHAVLDALHHLREELE